MIVTRTIQRFVHHILAFFRSCWSFLHKWYTSASQKPLLLDSGKRVFVGKQLAEGGFSVVLEAWDADPISSNNNTHTQQHQYVLKRIYGDAEVMEACRKEAQVHRTLQYHPNIMPLLGMCWTKSECYLLFPYCSRSLRSELQRRQRLTASSASSNPHASSPMPLWTELEVLQLFHGILDGIQAMHEHNYSHRDIKIDNVLLQVNNNHSNSDHRMIPVVMDFGSVGPTMEEMKTRRQVMQAMEHASMHTTISYRPPELFDGGIRVGDTVDYTKVDVWSLACTLFALSYGQGASPCECEFLLPHQRGTGTTKVVRMVDCTHLKVLAGLPSNPPLWYSNEFWNLLVDMMQQDPQLRPTHSTVIERVQTMIRQAGGEPRSSSGSNRRMELSRSDDADDDDAELALLSTNRLH